MTLFAELSREAMRLAVWAALVVGFIAGVLRRRR
jgi:hypothetical protein